MLSGTLIVFCLKALLSASYDDTVEERSDYVKQTIDTSMSSGSGYSCTPRWSRWSSTQRNWKHKKATLIGEQRYDNEHTGGGAESVLRRADGKRVAVATKARRLWNVCCHVQDVDCFFNCLLSLCEDFCPAILQAFSS